LDTEPEGSPVDARQGYDADINTTSYERVDYTEQIQRNSP
jgi:hypothetical protein